MTLQATFLLVLSVDDTLDESYRAPRLSMPGWHFFLAPLLFPWVAVRIQANWASSFPYVFWCDCSSALGRCWKRSCRHTWSSFLLWRSSCFSWLLQHSEESSCKTGCHPHWLTAWPSIRVWSTSDTTIQASHQTRRHWQHQQSQALFLPLKEIHLPRKVSHETGQFPGFSCYVEYLAPSDLCSSAV